MPLEHLQVFHIEDDPGDNILFARAVMHSGLPITRQIAFDAKHALDILKKQPRSFADIILLDIKLPDMTGLQVLEKIKGDPKHRHIPVIMFSTAAVAGDVSIARELGAIAYVQKPADNVGLAEFLERLYRACTTNRLASEWDWPPKGGRFVGTEASRVRRAGH